MIKGKKLVIFMIAIILILLMAIVCMLVKKTKENKKEYDTVLDKWKAGEGEKCPDEDIGQLIKDLLIAADKKDVEAIKKFFVDDVKNSNEFQTQIENFLNVYPGNISEYSMKVIGGSREGLYEEKCVYEKYDCEVHLKKDDIYYYITLKVCNYDAENSNNIGLEYLVLQSIKAYVLRHNEMYDGFINADIHTDEDFEVRFVYGYPVAYTYFERKLDDEELIEFIKKNNNIDDFKDTYGEPNGNNGFTDNIFYELVDENNSNNYLQLGVSKDGVIYEASIVNETGNVNYQLLIDENGEIYYEKEFD